MQLLISNLEMEKKALNLRLWEANISKIELAAEVTRYGSNKKSSCETIEYGREYVMSRIGIIESTVPIGKYLETDREVKESSIYVLNLSSNAEFVVNSEILQKLNSAKCQLLSKDATIKSLNDLLVQADSTLKSLQNQLQDE
jgi:hypothetical protein